MANREAKIKFTAETGSFNQAIKQANNEMSELRAELKLNETQMKATGATVEGLEAKHGILENQLKASESKTEALSQKVQKAVEIYGENSTEVSKLRTQLLNAQTAQEKMRQAVNECAAELDEQRSAANDAGKATESLTDKISRQQTELKQLKTAFVNAVDQYGETSDEAKKLAREIEDLSGELKQSESAFKQSSDAADKLDKSLDDVGDSAEQASDGFTIMKGAVADLVSKAIQFGIEKVAEFIGYLAELPEATRELRQDMATLETSFKDQALSTEQATETWKDLYAVFGEDDRAVEAANLIAKMSDNQQDLNDWVTITTGIWGSYQDSLPVEGLAEASMETAKTGEVTGVLADALNWSSEAATMFAKYMGEDVTTAEDAFNVALSECTTEQERQALITETLTALYGDAAAKYEEASGAQLAAKEATAENMLAQNELADAIEPVTTAWEGLKTELLVAVTPAIEAVCGGLENALNWLKEHPAAAKAVAVVVGVLAVAISGLAIALGIYTVAQWAANSALLAGMIPALVAALPIIAGVVAAIAAVALVVVFWDELKAAAVYCWEAIKAAWNAAGEWFSGLWEGIKSIASSAWEGISFAVTAAWDGVTAFFSGVAEWFNTNVIQPIVGFFTGLWQSIKNIWDTICNVVQVGIMLIGEILSAAFQIITLPFRFIWENCKEYVFAAWEWIKTKVSSAINAVKNTITTVWNAVKNVFTTVWNGIKSVVGSAWDWIKSKVTTAVNAVKIVVTSVWNAVKSVTSTVFNAVKSVVSSIWNGIKSAVTTAVNAVKSVVSSVWNSIKGVTSSVWNSIKGVVSNVWGGIKSAVSGAISNVKSSISSGLNSAKSTVSSVLGSIKSKFSSIFENCKSIVSNAINKIKGFFNFSWSLPKLKLPHFSITGKFSLNPPSVPKFSIQWYKNGGIMMNPTLFGINGNKLMAGGEAGPEAILPIDRLEGYIENAIQKTQNVVNLDTLAAAIEDLASRPISLRIGDREVALATAGASDSVNGLRSTFKNRGLVLD